MRDLSNQSEPSGGVWVRVPTTGDGIDLYRNNNYKRVFTVGAKQTYLEFIETDEDFDEFNVFLPRYHTFWSYLLFKMENIHTLKVAADNY